jgi:hypothetical protein
MNHCDQSRLRDRANRRATVLLVVAAAAFAATAAPSRAATRVPFSGVDAGSFVITQTPSPTVVATRDTATGHGTHVGAFSLVATEHVDLASLAVSDGAFTLVAANGDALYGTYAGEGRTTVDPAVIAYRASGPIIGGTGRFAGASGFLVWDGTANLATGDLGDRITGWIEHGGSR